MAILLEKSKTYHYPVVIIAASVTVLLSIIIKKTIIDHDNGMNIQITR